MFVNVVVLLCGACAFSVAAANGNIQMTAIPRYVQAHTDYSVVSKALKDNVISMKDNIPLLEDPRRHHAEIFHVIYAEAKLLTLLGHGSYDDVYEVDVNKLAPEGIADPKKVIDETVTFLQDIDKKISQVVGFMEHFFGPTDGTNIHVDELVKANNATNSAKALIAVGEASANLKQLALIDYVADNLNSVQFVITGKARLKDTVLSVAEVIRHLYIYS